MAVTNFKKIALGAILLGYLIKLQLLKIIPGPDQKVHGHMVVYICSFLGYNASVIIIWSVNFTNFRNPLDLVLPVVGGIVSWVTVIFLIAEVSILSKIKYIIFYEANVYPYLFFSLSIWFSFMGGVLMFIEFVQSLRRGNNRGLLDQEARDHPPVPEP